MKTTIYALVLAFVFVLALCALNAQTTPVPPEKIDIWTFDPGGQAPSLDYALKANEAYNAKEYEKAARLYMAQLQYKPDDLTSWYNLSCCFGLLSKADLAAKYLMRSYKAGYNDLEHIGKDTDFDNVRNAKIFTATVDSLTSLETQKKLMRGEKNYISATQMIPYYLHLPEGYDPKKSYPLVIGLHGYGDVATRFSGIWKYFGKSEVIFAAPEAPYPYSDMELGFSWQPEVDYMSAEMQTAYTQLTDYVLELKKKLGAEYNISETWLLGFSQGAFMGYMLALKNPASFSGLVACGGGLVKDVFTDEDYKAAKELKVIISHGKKDNVVPFEEAVNAKKILDDKKLTHVYLDEFDGGHSVSPTAITKLLEWIGMKQ
jgi:phospholipase/carboxylesterase